MTTARHFRKDTSKERVHKTSRAEQVSFFISLLILACVVGTVIFLWLSPSDSPARYRIEHGPVRREGEAFYLDFTITNEGDETGQQVTVEGSLKDEKASTTFDFIPGSSSEKGVLIFKSDPSEATLMVQSYQKP